MVTLAVIHINNISFNVNGKGLKLSNLQRTLIVTLSSLLQLLAFCVSFYFPSPSCLFFLHVLVQVIRDVLLLGHKQAFAWVDEWIGKLSRDDTGSGSDFA